MAVLPYENIKRVALAHARHLLPEWFPAGRIVGREFIVGNLRGDPGDSLSINLDTGVWADFDGSAKGGNLIELRAQARYGGNFKAAAIEIGRNLGVYLNGHPSGATPRSDRPNDDWQPMVPPPPGVAPPDASHFRGYSAYWEYTDATDRVTHYVRRRDNPDGSKDYHGLTYGTLNGIAGWHSRRPGRPLPLYGLNRLAAFPDAPVMICEGEKPADAAQGMFPSHACVSWYGGTGSVDHSDVEPLAGKDALIWPDNDDAGHKAARKLAARLPGARIIDVSDLPHGADAADIHPDDPAAWLAARIPPVTETSPPPPEGEGDYGDAGTDNPDNAAPEAGADAGKASTNDSTWPEPLDFLADAELTGAPELRDEHLPEPIRAFVFDTAARMGVDPCVVALSCLVSLSAVMSDDWCIQPKQFDDTWTENPRLWGAIVGDPSTMKSPVIRATTAPIDKLEAAAREQHEQDMLRYRCAHKAWKDAGSDPEAEPNHPKLERYLVENATIDAISEVLRNDPRATIKAPAGKVLVRQDEMSEWIAGFDRYRSGGKGGSDRGAYLRLFNGGRHNMDRVGRGNFAIPNWSASVLGGIQPGPIQRIAKDADDDGLLQRFCYVVPASQRRGEDRRPDAAARDRYAALFPALAALQPRADGAGGRVVLSAEAHEHRLEIADLAEALSALPDTSNRLKSALNKWPGIWARLTLIFHLVNVADAKIQGEMPVVDVVDRQVSTMATAYMRNIMLPHLLRAETIMFATEQSGHAHWIAGYILSQGMERIAVRDIMRSYKPLKAPEKRREIMDVVESMETMGWVRPVLEEGRQPTAWRVNPKVHSHFRERAKREKEERSATKERIRETLARRGNG